MTRGFGWGVTNSNMKNREPLSAFPAYFSYCSDILFFFLPCLRILIFLLAWVGP